MENIKTRNNINLLKYNNIRLNSIAREFYVPENYDELAALLKSFSDRKKLFYILSSGSNVLLKPYINTPVIYLMELDKSLTYDEEANTVTSGCSVKIQTLINFMADNNLGGIEYLYSLPASVGGCVCMNAGRGRSYNISISDYTHYVIYLDNEGLKKVSNSECIFTYRRSIFQTPGKIITKVIFKFPYQTKTLTKQKIKDRLDYVKVYQEPQSPSLGSVFLSVDEKIIKYVRGVRIGNAIYSKKTFNWISNLGNAKYVHVIILIKIVKLISFCLDKKAVLEIKRWK